MPKSVRIGRFLIRSRLPFTHEQLRELLHARYSKRNYAITLVREKVLRGIWTILELQ